MLTFKHIAAYLVLAGAIKIWQSGENINVADLNSNFAHIHNLMVGGHGGRLVDADVSASANIASSKLAGGKGIPRAWATAQCDGGACGILEGYNVTSVARSGGSNTATLSYTPTDAVMAVTATFNSGKGFCDTSQTQVATPNITLHCFDDTGTTVEGIYSFVVFDGN